MRGNIVLAVIAAAIVVVVIGAVAYTLTSTDDGQGETAGITSSDLIDHWYVSMEIVYTEEGDIEKSYPIDKLTLGDMSIDIYKLEGMSFYGLYGDQTLVGVISGPVFRLYLSYEGEYVTTYGYLFDSSTFILVFGDYSYDKDGKIVNSSAHLLVYTTDPSRPVRDPGYMDMLGKWICVNDSIAYGDQFSELGYGDIDIDRQEENMYSGKWISERGTTLDFKGVLFSNGTTYISLVIGARYVMISSVAPSGVLSATLSMMSNGQTVATNTTYMREDTYVAPTETNLVDTSWSVIDSSSLSGDGEISHKTKYFTITFTGEKNGVVVGEWKYGEETSTVTGTVIRSGNAGTGISLNLMWYEADKTNTSRTGYLDANGNIVLSAMYTKDDGSIVSSSYTLQKIVPSTIDLVGHWYLTRTIGYNNNDFFDRTIYDTPSICRNDIDVYGLANGQFYGLFTNSIVAGSYLDGLLVAEGVDIDGFICTIYGWLENDNTMTMIISGKDDSDISLCMQCTYSKTRGSVTALKTSIDIVDDWTAIEPFSMDIDGTLHDMKGTKINITEQHETAFKGTMEQMSGTTMVNYEIFGILTITPWGTAQGNVIDERGLVWNIQLVEGETPEEDCMMFNAVDVSPVFPIQGEKDCVERRYIRTGSADPGFDYIEDISGRTYVSDSMYIMTAIGVQELLDCDFEVKILYQENNLLSGEFSESINECSGTFVAHVLNNVGQPMFRVELSDNLHEGVYYGIAWSYNGNFYLETNSVIDGTAYQFTTLLTGVSS